MKTPVDIKDRLNEYRLKYRLSSDMFDPVTQARIQELEWVLEDESYISHDR